MIKILLLLIVFISGCATTQAQQQANIAQQRYQNVEQDANHCMQAVLSMESSVRLKEKLIFDLPQNEPNMARKLADDRYASDQDIKDAYELAFFRKTCQKKVLEGYGMIHPDYVILFSQMFAESDMGIADMANRKITIGELNKSIVERTNRAQADYQKISTNINSNLQQAHNYEVQQRQVASQQLAQWLIIQQQLYNQQLMINAINRPVMTNCYYQGAFLNCTSY